MGIITDIKLLDNNRAAANLLAASQDLRAQQTSVQAEITTKKPLVKADIENDIWNLEDIKNVIDLVLQNQALNVQKQKNKMELGLLRAALNDPAYQAELQAEEDLL